MHGLLIWWLLDAEHRLQGIWALVVEAQQLQFPGSRGQACDCGTWASLLRGMWDLPRLGIELASPALAGRFFITKPPRKPERADS